MQAARRTVKPVKPVKVPAAKVIQVAKPLAIPKAALTAKPTNGAKPSSRAESKTSAKAVAQKIVEPVIPADKDLTTKTARGVVKDRIVLMVPDPNWLHCHWELTVQSVLRAEAALGQEWYSAKPVIRLFDVTSLDTTSTAEAPVRDIAIRGGYSHWYIDVPQPPRSYRADIGYITRRGHFHPLCRSNVVTPPMAGQTEPLDESWPAKDDAQQDKSLATQGGLEAAGMMLQATAGDETRRATRDPGPDRLRRFGFEMNAELIVTGRTDPSARVTLQNEPMKLRTDGTFVMRYSLTDGRQIIPAVAISADGMEERTVVLAIERNTKYLDPLVHDLYSGEE